MPRILLTEEQKKANKKADGKKWRDNNKEYSKKWRDNNKEYAERRKGYEKKWREENKEKVKGYQEYNQTPKGKRVNRIGHLKSRGMIEPDGGWETFMEKVENTKSCDLCGIELTIDKIMTKTTRCVDHSHITNLFRNVVCHSCNAKLPKGT